MADNLIEEVDVQHFDVLVFGGGIAGLSIAERLAREARRRNKPLRIALVERARQLGGGSSGGLEGWFHTGALYSGLADGQTFKHCVKGVEQLINWYRKDPLFTNREYCNFDIATEAAGGRELFVPKILGKGQESPWFFPASYIHCALRQSLEEARTRTDRHQWRQQVERVKRRIATAYRSVSWEDDGIAKAPDLNRNEEGADFDLPTSPDAEMSNMLDSYDEEGHDMYEVFRSPDVVMDTEQILSHLARSAADNGVEFLTGTKLSTVNVPDYGAVRVTGVIAHIQASRERPARPMHLRAEQYIFALGAGFGDFEGIVRNKLGLRLKIRISKSVMAVVFPPLIERNFVRMDYYRGNHFNHVVRTTGIGANEKRYSMIANSAFDTESTELGQIAQSTEELLDTARKYFPETFHRDRTIKWYQCNKAEFFSDDINQRNYSYWCEPKILEESSARGGVTGSLRESLREIMLEILKMCVCNGSGDSSSLRDDLGKKYSQIDEIVEESLERVNREPANFLCVVPGKFTFFPSVAHDVYLEMESRGLFRVASPRVFSPRQRQPPDIAKPYPEQLLE